MSGGGEYHKGDVLLKFLPLLLECKTTTKNSFSLKCSVLKKISEEAFSAGKIPGMVISFETGRSQTEDWVLVPLDFLKGQNNDGDLVS